MLIRYWMNKPVITVEKNDSMQRAATLMKENHIRLLPVTFVLQTHTLSRL